ncbi:hypothetical protein COU79_02050 [Candidatus Peregrinibacteria bacterium CG10_big_fil_rev_8_21_14_0_10_54_7]|nr:MAG: hypothetical protein COU79_02050 [Candidatus Peregrinibacteria bacterium CG10_big_fil_rev_8_21_14_0_10_54_7]
MESSAKSIFLRLALPTTVVWGLFFLAGNYIESTPRPQAAISGIGETKVAEKPDIASVTLGVQTGRQESSQEAIETLEEQMNAVLGAVKALEIPEGDIQTSGFSLYPAYDWIEGEQVPRGYEASQNVTIKVRNPGKVGDVIGAATKAGANNVSGIQFLMDDMATLRDRARSESIAKAKKQAEDLAEELGMSLGKLTSYGEDISSFPDTGYGKGGYGGGGGTVMAESPVPIGEQEFTLRVYLTYELR